MEEPGVNAPLVRLQVPDCLEVRRQHARACRRFCVSICTFVPEASASVFVLFYLSVLRCGGRTRERVEAEALRSSARNTATGTCRVMCVRARLQPHCRLAASLHALAELCVRDAASATRSVAVGFAPCRGSSACCVSICTFAPVKASKLST
jgi:hypothetical protein